MTEWPLRDEQRATPAERDPLQALGLTLNDLPGLLLRLPARPESVGALVAMGNFTLAMRDLETAEGISEDELSRVRASLAALAEPEA